jgi:alcohol dehydrogenase class IV
MKHLILLPAILLFSLKVTAQQSIWEIATGVTFEVQTNSDFCVDSIVNVGGTLIFDGTKCGNLFTAISTPGEIPKEFRLYNNYPNPFYPFTTITFTLEKSELTSLKIYNGLKQEVKTLIDNEYLEAGKYHQLIFEASNLPGGVYIARLQSGDKVQMKKMILLK